MKKVYFIPNIITALGLSCGLFVIFKVNMIEPGAGTYQVLFVSAILLLVAAFADLLDGAVARAMRAESEFGLIFDSLSDAICFGVAPSVLFLKSLSMTPGTAYSFFAAIGAMMYSLCGVLRLVRYNIKAAEAKLNPDLTLSFKKHFTGLPIPAAALSAVAMNLFFASSFFEEWFLVSHEQKGVILTILMFILGYLMVSRLKFPSSKMLHFKMPSFQLIFFTVLFAICFFYGVLYYFPLMLVGVTWLYIILALLLSFIRLLAGKKSKTLEDFEPDEED